MAKIVSEDEWNEIQGVSSNGKSGYFVLKEDDGTVTVTLKSPHLSVKMGEQDSLNRMWQKDWTKNEIKVDINGPNLEEKNKGEKVLLLGGMKSPLLRYFIKAWKANGLNPKTIEGTKWEVTKTDTYEYTITRLDTDDSVETPSTKTPPVEKQAKIPEKKKAPTTPTEKVQEIIDIATELKSEPELQEGMSVEDFIAAVGIRGEVSMVEIEKNLKTLERKKIIVINDDIVTPA